MAQDKNEKLRSEYTQKIVEKERQIDDLNRDKRQIQEVVESLETELTRNFRQLQELNEELIKEGSSSARWEQEELNGKKKHFGQFFKEQKQELTEMYTKTAEQLNEERSKIQKERNEVSWD
ncbi:hypothetical protein CKN73_01640 [Carnobacterium divergens]|uniref:Uncharacterized protein n=1 Tax=Carnobacterium divergens TaxID=2748 RepID=A0A4R9CLU5_CARDV|nr:hypothetical protein [Carnobacterium divergens]MDT2011679.1 hypothetical protein [Carnobacterium divergens]TFI75790.1 hypothetical protein CKN58_01090 [Carnobacterium divergens]TFI79726.1 hypothetical protein CKN85_01090 [Carnobacterium divergens]TFI85986.1 hypothetical protein CKN56_01090 [Carnobacterium divergens]TFI98564.1 hypothetical protein CKN64_01090 [Carnobacterium divergens]